MIKINLLKSASNEPVRRNTAIEKAVITGFVILTLLIIAGGGAFLLHWRFRQPHTPKPAETASSIQAEKKTPVESSPLVAPDDFEPSTHAKSKMVEDVVDEVDAHAVQSSAPVVLHYHEMSRGEKINHEILFARNTLQILTRIVPDGIGFNSLALDSFSTVSAAGFGASREQVGSLFAALRRERLDLLGPPRSYINPSGGRGYQFFFSCAPLFDMNETEPYQAIDRLESRENIPALHKTFRALAARDGVVLRDDLQPVSADKWGEFLRLSYHISGHSSYRNFVKFVLDVYDARITCAFSRVRLTARSETSVDIDADVIFTLRE